MSKMLFTFRWGKSVYVTDKDLKKILLQYYTKTEVDEILKQYAKIEDVAAELVEYAKLDDLNILDNHLQGMINDNTDLINGNTETLNEVVDALKNARLWNIVGVWNAETTYKIGDVVGYNDELYLSIVNDNLNHTPSNVPTNWVKVTNVQSFNLDDYYNKIQINDLLNEYAKLDKDNTYAQGKRNVFRTLPEVYTERTLPTKNTDLTTKKYVDDNFLTVTKPSYGGVEVGSRFNVNGLLSMRNGNDIEMVDNSGYKSIHKDGNNLQWGGKNLATEEYVNNKVGTGGSGSGSGIRAKRVGISLHNFYVDSNYSTKVNPERLTIGAGERARTDFRTSFSTSDSYVDWINTNASEFRDALYEGRLIFGGQRLRNYGEYKSFGFIDKMYCDGNNWLYLWWINLSTSQQTWNFRDGDTYYFTMILE